jgi:hypothetical protein
MSAPRPPLHQDRLLRHPWHREMLESRRSAAEEEERARRRGYLLYLLSFAFWSLLGLLLCTWGMHTSNPEYGRVAVEAGVLIANAGVIATLCWAYARGGR